MPVEVLQCEQENSKATERTGALLDATKDRRMWLELRRALFIAIQAIEERHGMAKTRAGG